MKFGANLHKKAFSISVGNKKAFLYIEEKVIIGCENIPNIITKKIKINWDNQMPIIVFFLYTNYHELATNFSMNYFDLQIIMEENNFW